LIDIFSASAQEEISVNSPWWRGSWERKCQNGWRMQLITRVCWHKKFFECNWHFSITDIIGVVTFSVCTRNSRPLFIRIDNKI
jgi:hypothetical protein